MLRSDATLGAEFLRFETFMPRASVLQVTTTRLGGTSTGPFESMNVALHVGDSPENVLTNRRRVAARFGLPLEHWAFAEQVHGTSVWRATAADRGRGTLSTASAVPATDALLTDAPGLCLA